jgi:DNA-binding beta-propeller fold protein YncE
MENFHDVRKQLQTVSLTCIIVFDVLFLRTRLIIVISGYHSN